MVHWSHKRLVIRNPAIYRSGEVEEGRRVRQIENSISMFTSSQLFFYRGIENKNNNSRNYICYRRL